MSCLCGDTCCPACYPGAALYEARWNATYEKVNAFFGEFARAVDRLMDDGSYTGLERVTNFVLDLLNAERGLEPVPVEDPDIPDWWESDDGAEG